MKEHLSKTLLVGVDFSDEDTGVLIVCEIEGVNTKVKNLFHGKEAKELYEKLITVQKKEEKSDE